MYFINYILLLWVFGAVTPAIALTLRSTAVTPSKYGLCGPLFHQTCTGSKFGASCSWFDICGPISNSLFSGSGCQSSYGVCSPSKGSTKPTATPTTTPGAGGGTPIATSAHNVPTAALPAGTAVAIKNPSFESTTISKRSRIEKRQSASQVSQSSPPWVISSCNGGTTNCEFENYDSQDGLWAFMAPNGGTIYQSNVLLTIGASYLFTWYWKTVVPSGDETIQGVFLGTGAYTDLSDAYTVGTPGFGLTANADWAEQTISMGELDCDTVTRYGVDNGNGTATFRMFLNGEACPTGTPCYVSPTPTYTWYVDNIRVQQTASATAVTTC